MSKDEKTMHRLLATAKKAALPATLILLAFVILIISVFRTASVVYRFDGEIEDGDVEEEIPVINYTLAYPGKVLPGDILWPIKALRDRLWLATTANPDRKADLLLLYADKRLVSGEIIFRSGKVGEGFAVLTKAEKYLEKAAMQEELNRRGGIDTTVFLYRLSQASLKHIEILRRLYLIAPEHAKPDLINIENYAQNTYEKTMHALNEKQLKPVQENPFDR
jgi:hypothetical protein